MFKSILKLILIDFKNKITILIILNMQMNSTKKKRKIILDESNNSSLDIISILYNYKLYNIIYN